MSMWAWFWAQRLFRVTANRAARAEVADSGNKAGSYTGSDGETTASRHLARV